MATITLISISRATAPSLHSVIQPSDQQHRSRHDGALQDYYFLSLYTTSQMHLKSVYTRAQTPTCTHASPPYEYRCRCMHRKSERERERVCVCVRLSSKAPMNSGGATWPRGVRHPSCPGEEERERERDRERERERERAQLHKTKLIPRGWLQHPRNPGCRLLRPANALHFPLCRWYEGRRLRSERTLGGRV